MVVIEDALTDFRTDFRKDFKITLLFVTIVRRQQMRCYVHEFI